MKILSKSVGDTRDIAENIAAGLRGNEIIILNGELGAGKTTFTAFLAAALGVKCNVTSPTFAFMKEYSGKFPVFHFDLYRAESQDEVYELGIHENLDMRGVKIIEWNKFDMAKRNNVIRIDIQYDGENGRVFDIKDGRIQ